MPHEIAHDGPEHRHFRELLRTRLKEKDARDTRRLSALAFSWTLLRAAKEALDAACTCPPLPEPVSDDCPVHGE